MGRAKRICYLSPMRAAKVQASLRIRAVSPEPSLLAHTNSESRGTFRQKARSLAPLNGWACAVEICHDGMLEDTNSLDGAQILAEVFQLVRGVEIGDLMQIGRVPLSFKGYLVYVLGTYGGNVVFLNCTTTSRRHFYAKTHNISALG